MNIFASILDALWSWFHVLPAGHLDLDRLAAESKEKNLDWRNSVVDLMKLTGMDSSPAGRRSLARQLGYPGRADGSAEMNIWLHQKIMEKLR